MDKAKPINTPMTANLKLTKQGHYLMSNPTLYRSIVGLAVCHYNHARNSILCQQSFPIHTNPLEEHWMAVKHILCHLASTLTHGITLSKPSSLQLTGFCDVDWGNDLDDRRSTLCLYVFLGNNLISWSSKKHLVFPRSSTEAKYKSLASVITEILWLQSLLT